MLTYNSIFNYDNRQALLDDNVRTISYLLKDLGIRATMSTIVKRIVRKRSFPALSKLDIAQVLATFYIQAIPCKLNISEVIRYGNKSLVLINDHYVYVTGMTDHSIEYFHPVQGKKAEELSQFQQKWTGEVIICNSPVNIYHKENFEEMEALDKQDIAAYLQEVQYINHFISVEECKQVIHYCEENNLFERSKVTSLSEKSSEENYRTSYSAFIEDNTIPLFASLTAKAAAFTNKELTDIEDLQCVRYSQGQEFKFHFDSNTKDLKRDITMLIYLNDDYEGGETYFPLIDHKVIPKKGDALLFKNLDKNRQPVIYSAHAGLPVYAGTKYALNIWIN